MLFQHAPKHPQHVTEFVQHVAEFSFRAPQPSTSMQNLAAIHFAMCGGSTLIRLL